MRARTLVFSLVLGLGAGAGIGVGCAASTNPSGGAGGTGGAGAGGGSGGIGLIGPGGSGGGFDPDAACAKFTAEAKQAPAAMLFVVDGSTSMVDGQKWTAAQEAIINSIDKPAFDNMGLGLTRFPASLKDPPACLCTQVCMGPCPVSTCKQYLELFGQDQGMVACGFSTFPQVPIADSGLLKTNDSSGVRKDMYQYMVNAAPQTGDPADSSPIFDTMQKGYVKLQEFDTSGRVLVLITDGGFSCTSLSNRPGINDNNGCPDWEDPDTVNVLISTLRNDPAKPVYTFVIGVPGSDSNGEGVATGAAYDTPPYRMRRALSTYAYSGAPDLVPAGCDHAVDVSTSASDPNPPCHFDLSQGNFNADALATAIDEIRGKALGCVYDIPAPPPGETVDLGLVNVNVTINGVTYALPKRVDPMDACQVDGCWDFKGTTQIELVGKSCTDLADAMTAKVDVLVGCQTITK